MIIDMHVHSDVSDDAAATVEGYLKWLGVLRRKHHLDGIVFTEHRAYRGDLDYRRLAEANDLLILHGSEVETDCGHFLIYGVTQALLDRFDFANTALHAPDLVKEVRATGGIAIPSHPGRINIGFADYAAKVEVEIQAVETLNGGSSKVENERALELAAERGYYGIGGSDAHYVSSLATCSTEFQDPVRSIEELVEALYRGRYRAVRLENTKRK